MSRTQRRASTKATTKRKCQTQTRGAARRAAKSTIARKARGV